MHKISLSRISRRFLHYGIFAALCHVTFVLLMASTSGSTDGTALFYRFFPMLEHSLMSFAAILFGVLGAEYIEKSKQK